MSVFAVRAALLCVCALFLQHASAELQGRCPSELADCPARASPCNSDDECGSQVCCTTSCGKTCVDPMFTGCENIKMSTERISRALAAENIRSGRGRRPSFRSPRCRASDGEFEPIQCDNEIVSSCWCVDQTGFEIPGTRAPAAGLVNCSRAAPCAAHTCRMLCPLGFELDEQGCPLCKCRDPCSTITCPGQLSCQLEETPCLRPPCPPVPTCKRGRSLQNICPIGDPLLISETSRPFLCGTDPGKPNCPPLYRCLVESGNDYGVCCPASLELQKAGTCPTATSDNCGTPCNHDLECPSMHKCCDGGECGKHCTLPHNVTLCTQQKMLAELLVVSEREGRGYVPQCGDNGEFESRQCSRNGLVCWCVDTEGNKLRGSMGPSEKVRCSRAPHPARHGARSLNTCTKALCAGVCEYGYKSGADGCPTCECDDPCMAYPCADGEECVRVKDADCSGEFCTGYPVCRPKISYENPCEHGVPVTEEDGIVVGCGADADCPESHTCTRARRSDGAVCCPMNDNSTESDMLEIESCGVEAEAVCGLNSTTSCHEGTCENGFVCCSTTTCGPMCVDVAKMRLQGDHVDDVPTMCEYLRDFDEKMEGTVDGMKLALPAPKCNSDGSFTPQQCANGKCWCVDSFGTEIPDTRTSNATSVDCDKIRSELDCLDLTCRMGCDYGFELGANRCPTCRCRDPCNGVTCPEGRSCAVVDVACDQDYCPPVPACLPRKPGQCPYLVPDRAGCEFQCRSDADCAAAERCCATGCGAACARALHRSACQQARELALHMAAESGSPPSWSFIPACKEDGSFERIQCRSAVCWCVDNVGKEVPGTRVTNSTPTCDVPAICPDPQCEEDEICPHGKVLDNAGCPTCNCRDPCAETKCKADESCELVTLECEGEYCPPLARCVPTLECPNGAPLQAPDDSGPLICGPSAAACPSTHACRFVPNDTKPSLCCPKPRSVCFEAKDEGLCSKNDGLNTTRWFFNHERNRCERFRYQGCSGNHNNFRTKEECNSVCPVLSPCERLREKNEAAAQKYGKGTFIPVCDSTGSWEPVQCMSHIDVCWCVSARGEPLKGSLVRGDKPTCNFRQARKLLPRDPLDEKARADDVLEELIRQMTAYRVEQFSEEDESDSLDLDVDHEMQSKSFGDDLPNVDIMQNDGIPQLSEVIQPLNSEAKSIQSITAIEEKNSFKTKCLVLQEEVDSTGYGVRPRCLADGSFAPRQCSKSHCWCVDAAGQKRPQFGLIPDLPGVDTCETTTVESALLELEWINANSSVADRVKTVLSEKLSMLGSDSPVSVMMDKQTLKLRAVLLGPKAVDIVYHIENLVKQEKLAIKSNRMGSQPELGADVIRSEYRLASSIPAMQQREILSESTVSAATSYHTALIVLAATSAFIISILCVLVMLYRARLQREPHKAERFLPPAPPVYVLSADEKAELAKVLNSPPHPILPNNTNDDRPRV